MAGQTHSNENGGRVIALSGGVGGAKLSLGLSHVLAPGQLSVVVNTGDDFEHLGLPISPDIDTTLYTLGNVQNTDTGWGRKHETWTCLETLDSLGGETWFRIGDRDIATHLFRLSLLNNDKTLSQATSALAKALGIEHEIVPMSDDPVRTIVSTPEGDLSFQEYFVKHQCAPEVLSFHFDGLATSTPSPGFQAALDDPALTGVIICPSNPFVSVDPILDIPGIRDELSEPKTKVIAVSPIVGGQALKGPAAKMMAELKIPASPLSVAQHYGTCLDGFVIDTIDQDHAKRIEDMLNIPVLVCNTVMTDLESKTALAQETLDFLSDIGA